MPMTHRLFPHSQVHDVMSAHLVTMETPEKRVDSVSPVSVTTTLTCWTQTPVMPTPGSVCSVCTTAKARPAGAANWVTMAMPHCMTVGVSTLGDYNKNYREQEVI